MITFLLQIQQAHADAAANFYENVFGAVVRARNEVNTGIEIFVQIGGFLFQLLEVVGHTKAQHRCSFFPVLYRENVVDIAQKLEGVQGAKILNNNAIEANHQLIFRDPFGFVWRVCSINMQPNLLPPNMQLRRSSSLPNIPPPADGFIMLTSLLHIRHPHADEAANFYVAVFGADIRSQEAFIIEGNRDAQLGRKIVLEIEECPFELYDVVNAEQRSYIFPVIYRDDVNVIVQLLEGMPNVEILRNEAIEGKHELIFRDPYGFVWRVFSPNMLPVLSQLPNDAST